MDLAGSRRGHRAERQPEFRDGPGDNIEEGDLFRRLCRAGITTPHILKNSYLIHPRSTASRVFLFRATRPRCENEPGQHPRARESGVAFAAPGAYSQPRSCFCRLVQHFQSVPFSLAQSDSLRARWQVAGPGTHARCLRRGLVARHPQARSITTQ